MSTDKLFTYFDELAITAEAAINHSDVAADKSDGQGLIDHGGANGMGLVRGLWLVIANRVLWEDATTAAVFLLEQDTEPAFGSPETLGTYTASTALIPAGELIANVPLPAITQRYSRVSATWTTNEGAGVISAFITDAPTFTYPGRAAVVVAS